eukprot:sb/3474931/
MTNIDAFIKLVAHSNAFKSIIMTCILLNTFTFAISSSLDLNPKTRNILEILDGLDSCFLAIYTMEFAIKLYSLGRGYWFNGFNCFDFGVLLCSHLQVILTHSHHVTYSTRSCPSYTAHVRLRHHGFLRLWI